VLYYVLLGMIAVTVVILIRIVGIILVIALLTVPAALARQLSHNMAHMMAIAIVLNFVFTFSGLLISFYLNLASGATIVIVSCFCFFTFIINKTSSSINHRIRSLITPTSNMELQDVIMRINNWINP